MARFPTGLLCTALLLALSNGACNRRDKEVDPLPAKQSAANPSGDADSFRAWPLTVATSVPGMAGPVAGADRAFVAAAANSGLAEVQAGRLAAGKSSQSAIRAFALQMERDHGAVNEELKRLAGQKGIDLPTTVEGEPRSQLARLGGLSGAALDRAFVQDFGIDLHQKAIALFEREARESQDADLKTFAERTLARLREHLAMAQQLQVAQER